MARKSLAYGLLLVTLLWLVASYLPENILLLPKVSLDGWLPLTAQQTIFYIIMAAFILIQGSLVVSMNRLFRSDGDAAGEHSAVANNRLAKFGLRKGPEVIWTSVPLAMTLVILLWVFTVFS